MVNLNPLTIVKDEMRPSSKGWERFVGLNGNVMWQCILHVNLNLEIPWISLDCMLCCLDDWNASK